MTYSVNFMDLTERISPLAFAKYLRDTGWELFQSKRAYIKIFQYERNDDFFQIIIPMEKKLSDYKEAMYKAVETVAKVENKSIEQVMLYLLNPNTDILKIRLEKKDIEAGNILLDDAIRIYENAKKLLAATARDILHPKKYHQGKMDDCVLKFLSSCRFGQTEVGSYVVSVVCPFAELDENEEYKQLSIFSDEEQCANSLTRQVTSRVMENISFIKSQIDNGEMDKLVLQDEDKIISANFYEALGGLNLDSNGADVEFIAEWSPIVKNIGCVKNRILLTHDYYQPIETTIGKLKEQTNKSTKIIGRIKKLESSPDVQKRKIGKITVVYLDENDKPKTVTANLDKNEYDQAIKAHEKGYHVEIVGEISYGKRAFMSSCESFVVIE